MSNDPERNDILRLDEMMSRKPGSINTYQSMSYFIGICYRYLFIDSQCDSNEIWRGTKLPSVDIVRFIVDGAQGSL